MLRTSSLPFVSVPIGVRLAMFLLALGPLQVTLAQPTDPPPDSSEAWHEDAWNPILQQDGLHISYLYYPDADNKHDGIVLRLANDAEEPLRYAFTLVFRAPEAETDVSVQGRLEPGEMRTGEEAGLFWIPFRDSDRNIGEIGLRGLEIDPGRRGPPKGSSPP